MTTNRKCPKCGAQLAPGTSEGLCPKCLLAECMGTGSGSAATVVTPVPEDGGRDEYRTSNAQHPTSNAQRSSEEGQKADLKTTIYNPQAAIGAKLRYFGDYELLTAIAQGGMGIVYKARQISLNRAVAVKMILAGPFATESYIKRFRTEAEAAASLQHPNIVAIHEVGEHEGQHYFSMDYVEGQSLAQMVQENPLPAKRAARYVQIIAEAIHYAHGKGILHRDLKPSNVLIDANDQPHITDFDLAKRMGHDSEMTMSGQVLGTPSYLPPEQASSKRGKVGPHSDVYSLGAILYHLLAGRPPFLGASVTETLDQVLNTEPAAPRALNPGVPKDLETICLKCLEKDAKRRYASAQALTEDLKRWQKGEPIQARPITHTERIFKWVRRKPVVAGLAAALSIALVGGTFFSWRYAIKAERLARLATKERDWADEKMEQSLRLLYYNQINMAEREWSSGNLEAADDLLKKCEPQRRGWEWHYLDRAVNSELVNLQISNVLAFTFSQDGKYLATVGFDLKETGMVSLRDPVTGVKTKTLLSPDATNRLFAALAFSGNGHRLAALGSKLWGSPSIERIKSALFRSPLPLNSRLEWLLDVKNDPSPLVVIWDIDTAKVIRSFTVGKGCQNVELDHDGEYLLICPENGPIQAVETLSGRRLPTMGSAPASISPDGKHMLAHTGNLKPQIFPVGTSLPAIPLSPLETKFYLAKKLCLFSPTGRLMAYSHADAVGIFDAKSGQRLHNIVCGSEVQSLAFSGDSQNLAIMEKTRIKVWNINEAREVWKVRGYFDNLTMPATPRFTISFLPNGYHIALLHSHGKNPSNESIKIWDIRQAANPTKLTIPWGRAVNEIVFSRDGKLVAALGSVDRTIRETPAIGAAYGNIGIWDTHQGYKIKEFMVDNSKENLQKNFTMFAFSPDAKYFAFCSNRTMQVWEFNSSSPKSIISCKESLYYINQMYWSSNGITWVETNGLVNVWNPLTEKTPKVLSLTPTNERVCMFNERQLVFFKPKVLQIWNLFPARMFKELKWPEGSRRPWLVADRFEEMKPMPAIIFNEHNMTIYDLQKGDVMCQCVNVAEPWQISSSWFSTSTDFSRLAIVNKDNAVRIWDIRSGNNVLTLRGHKKQVHYARFSVNGHMLATASDDEIHIYNGAPKRNIDGIAP